MRNPPIMRNPHTYLIGFTLLLAIGCLSVGWWGLRSSTETEATNSSPLPVNGPAVSASSKGITVSMHIAPNGPYFLSELIAVDISLTNHTPSVVSLPEGCGPSLWAELTGGGPPTYNLPPTPIMSCPGPIDGPPISPGATVTSHQMLPLTASGHVQLAAGRTMVKTSASVSQDAPSPTIGVTVNPHIPAGRTLSLRREGAVVAVNATAAAREHLFYSYSISCGDPNNGGTTETSNYTWESLPGEVISPPGCPGANPQWHVSVSAIGYAIASATYPFASAEPS